MFWQISKLFSTPMSIIPIGRHMARVLSVYDGDTIKVAIVHYGTTYSYTIRLSEIDTPELKYKGLNIKTEMNNTNDIKILKGLRKIGFAAKDRVERIIADCPRSIVVVNCIETEKYGRLLAEVYPTTTECCGVASTNKSINKMLLDEGYATSYSGDKRSIISMIIDNKNNKHFKELNDILNGISATELAALKDKFSD
jgi:endonuclease YncB( thermonuclease family)